MMINEPEIGDRIHSLLSQYGRDMGLQKLREEVAATPNACRRNMWFQAHRRFPGIFWETESFQI
jgi:hypothetical protein